MTFAPSQRHTRPWQATSAFALIVSAYKKRFHGKEMVETG